MKINKKDLKKIIEAYMGQIGVTSVGGGPTPLSGFLTKTKQKNDPDLSHEQSIGGPIDRHFSSEDFVRKANWYYSERAFGDDTNLFLHPILGTTEAANQKFKHIGNNAIKGLTEGRVTIMNLENLDNFLRHDLELSEESINSINRKNDTLLLPIVTALTKGTFKVSPHMIFHSIFDSNFHPRLELIVSDFLSFLAENAYGTGPASFSKTPIRKLLTLKGSSVGSMSGGDFVAESLTQELLQYPAKVNQPIVGDLDGRGFNMNKAVFESLPKEQQSYLMYRYAPQIRMFAKIFRERIRGKAVFTALI